MGTLAHGTTAESAYPVRVRVEPAIAHRNRLTTAFRLILAFPHLILVGGPAAVALWWGTSSDGGTDFGWSSGGGVLGVVAVICAVIAWFAIIFARRHPHGLWNLAAFYLRWRVRAVAYATLLRDEYPPFGDGPYPATLSISEATGDRDRLTVAFRIFLAIPHLIATWALGIAWGVATIVGWFSILFTGRYPDRLYRFATAVFQWNIRVEAYLLLLRDEYPPFSFHAV